MNTTRSCVLSCLKIRNCNAGVAEVMWGRSEGECGYGHIGYMISSVVGVSLGILLCGVGCILSVIQKRRETIQRKMQETEPLLVTEARSLPLGIR